MRILAVLLVLLLFVFNTVSALRLNNPDFVDERYVEIGGPKNRPPKQSLRYPLPLLLRHCDSHYRFIFDITQNPEIFLKYELFNTESKAIIQASHNGETIMPVAKVQLPASADPSDPLRIPLFRSDKMGTHIKLPSGQNGQGEFTVILPLQSAPQLVPLLRLNTAAQRSLKQIWVKNKDGSTIMVYDNHPNTDIRQEPSTSQTPLDAPSSSGSE